MEDAVDNLEKHVKNTGEKLDSLALKVDTVEEEVLRDAEDEAQVEVFELLQSVTEVKNDYQNLRKEIMEVQVLQKELTNSLREQLKLVQGRFDVLKSKVYFNPKHSVRE